MKKNKIRELQEVARKLPTLTVKVGFGRIYGYELSKKGITKDADGKPVDENKIYKTHQRYDAPVNHFTALKKAYQSGGDEAAKKYITEVFKKHETTQKNLPPQA